MRADLLDLILSVNFLTDVLVSLHELVKLLGQFFVLLRDYSDVVLQAVDFVLHFCIFVNLSLFRARMSVGFLLQEGKLGFQLGDLSLHIVDLFLQLHVFGLFLLDSEMEVLVLRNVFLLHAPEVFQLLVETIYLAFILNYFVFVFLQLVRLVVKFNHFGLQLFLHGLDFADLDLDELLLRLLLDVHLVDALRGLVQLIFQLVDLTDVVRVQLT